jgi:mannose-6-phosphate isomerase-like protein (cupin superfamily)
MTVMIATTDSPVRIEGVHGGTGEIEWKCFARLHMLHSDMCGFEHARLGPGLAVGAHTHSRTDEIYFIVSGTGEMQVDDDTRTVGRGDLILAPQGTTHALRNTGDASLDFIVIEVFPPAVRAVLPAFSPVA